MNRAWTIFGVADEAPPENGLLLFFRTDDFDGTLRSVRAVTAV